MIEQDELGPLLEKQAASNSLNIIAGIFLAVATFLSISTAMDIVRISNDETIPLVVCPRTYDLDRPILMKTILASSVKEKDAYLKGFIRQFIQSQFPRTKDDAKPALEYISSHTDGALHRRFAAFTKNADKFESLVEQGYYYEFYAENSLDLKIRSTGSGSGEWVVEVGGEMTKHVMMKELRTTPTLRYVVKAGEHTLSNPEGLYVTDGNILEYIDYISGRKGSE